MNKQDEQFILFYNPPDYHEQQYLEGWKHCLNGGSYQDNPYEGIGIRHERETTFDDERESAWLNGCDDCWDYLSAVKSLT